MCHSQNPFIRHSQLLCRGNPRLWTMLVRITAVKDQDIFRSKKAQGCLLQPAEPISFIEARKGRSGPGSGLIRTLRARFMQVPYLTKLLGSSACQTVGFREGSVFVAVLWANASFTVPVKHVVYISSCHVSRQRFDKQYSLSCNSCWVTVQTTVKYIL